MSERINIRNDIYEVEEIKHIAEGIIRHRFLDLTNMPMRATLAWCQSRGIEPKIEDGRLIVKCCTITEII